MPTQPYLYLESAVGRAYSQCYAAADQAAALGLEGLADDLWLMLEELGKLQSTLVRGPSRLPKSITRRA